MDEQRTIAAALDACGLPPLSRVSPLSGGCIHQVRRVVLTDDRVVVVKCAAASAADLFHGEARSLTALREAQCVFVPEVLGVGTFPGGAALVMTELIAGRPSAETWSAFGCELAALHRSPSKTNSYGFDVDNHLGLTPQINTWCTDWVEFNTRHRLGPQIELARTNGLLDGSELDRCRRLTGRLERFIPRSPHPALLHGDLWSGNAIAARDHDADRIAVIDPACSFGDGWADIAMMRLFGGFPAACHEAYAETIGETNVAPRIAVYQLYHLLNHVNLFGRGYAAQAMGIVDQLLGA